jgi:diguanylate cyclase (GGDEF)-like protein
MTSTAAILERSNAQLHFWKVYLRAGLTLLVTETAASCGYLLMTPHGPHRLALKIIGGTVMTVAILLAPLVPRIARSHRRELFAFALTLLACFVFAICGVLDGGIDSTPLALIALPVMWAGVGLPPRSVGVAGLASLAEIAVLGGLDPNDGIPGQHVLILSALVSGVAALAYVSSVNRSRLERKEVTLAAELVRLADTNGLTGCLNYRAFERSIGAEVDRALRHHEPVSLLVADVDLLKTLNDAHGHLAGDAALESVGTLLRASIRSFDRAARIGGDEFAVILPNTTLADAAATAGRIAAALDSIADRRVSLSIGVATLGRSDSTAKQLIHDADAAMYVAKLNGRRGIETTTQPPASRVHVDRTQRGLATLLVDHRPA